jgi:Family of unknown function (DUF5317)
MAKVDFYNPTSLETEVTSQSNLQKGKVTDFSPIGKKSVRFVAESYVWLVWIPLLLLATGIGMNLLAVTMNHGNMPVVLPPTGVIAEKDSMHVAATANSRFLFLCDWIQLQTARHVASPGDFLITAGDSLKWPLVWMWVGFTLGHSTWRKLIGSYASAS